ncbi:hypothetical protein Tco_1254582 [Tanacetum coccineum]
MSDQKFADTHNLVAFLEKPTKSEGFEEIVDFLNANPIKYALTINPIIYCSCIKQFWDTIKAKTVNGEVQLQALVDKKKVIITESTIRRDLQLEDANGVDCLPNAAIFDQLTLMRVKTLGSGEDRLSLKELIDLCTKLSNRVLNLETTKTAQAKEIASLKKRVKKLERKRKSRTPGLRRLRKVGSARRIESSNEASLGAQEDTSKQGKKIADIDANAEVTLIDETQGKNKDNLMFDTGVLDDQEVKVEKRIAREKEEANIALNAQWNDIQDKVETDYELAQRLQAEEQEELTIEEKSKLFQQLLEKRMKHFAAKRAEERRNMDTELVEGSEIREEESSSKRAGDELEQEPTKKQKVDDDKEREDL